MEDLNIRDGSTTPMVTTDAGSPSPLTPKSRKRTFPDSQSAQPTRFNPDLEDGSHRIYSGTQRYSIYDYSSRTMSMARMRDPAKGAAQVPTPAQTEPSSPATTETGAAAQYQMLLQPETRPISEEQLINEVRGIYAGLVMVEKKCVEIDQQQASKKTELSNEQWQALIALHRTLLHEHHDFFLASQHPSASLALRKLASKYAMPARMWRHGIHSLLELLRHRLPDALEHMIAFICTAYSMMALLVESVPAFEDTWIECLGDLARYRMAIEEADLRDREVWAGVARYWYNKAANKSPNVGRIQHHLAVLARPNILQQLFFYTKSLVCVQAFPNTNDSIQLLFNPILKPGPGQERPPHAPMVTSFVKTHGILFGQDPIELFLKSGNEFMTHLSSHISRVGSKFREQGVHLASVNFAAMLGYGKEGSVLMQLFNKGPHELLTPNITNSVQGQWSSTPLPNLPLDSCGLSKTGFQSFRYASYFSFHVLSFTLRHMGNKNIVPHIHTSLVFLYGLALYPQIMTLVEMEVPWQELVTFLNALINQRVPGGLTLGGEYFPTSDGSVCHLPEDYLMRGQVWSSFYHPDGFFDQPSVDDDEHSLELPSMAIPRAERCLWLAHRLASVSVSAPLDECDADSTY